MGENGGLHSSQSTIRAGTTLGVVKDSFVLVCSFIMMRFLAVYQDRHVGWWWLMLAVAVIAQISSGIDLLTMLLRKTTVTLSPTTLDVQVRSFSRKVVTKSFLTRDLHDLRFVRSTVGANIRNKLKQDEVQFDENSQPHLLVSGITEKEADALMAKIREVFSFPNDRHHEFSSGR